jgi:hypothetical protein
MNLIINVEDDEKLILADDSAVLAWQGIGKWIKRKFKKGMVFFFLIDSTVENETELSFFHLQDYLEFKKHPDVMKW